MTFLTLFLQTLVNGLLLGAVYAIAALGLSLIWGVMGVVNLAHGSFLILSAYIVYWSFVLMGVPPIFLTPLTVILGFLLGYLLYKLVGKTVVSLDPSTSLLFFFGVSLFVSNMILNLWGPDVRGIPWLVEGIEILDIRVPISRLVALIMVAAGFLTLYWMLRHTYYGKAIRAVVVNKTGAMSVGINIHAVYALSLGLGLGLTFFSGNLIALVNPFTPVSGDGYLMYSFATVVLGGVGNVFGALLAGLLIGVIESIIGVYFTQSISPAVAFIILVLVITVKNRVSST